MRIPEARVQDLLHSWPVARLATLSADGSARQVPIVFVHAHGELWSPIDGKPKRGGELARLRHVRADPRVQVLLDSYREDWSRLWWIAIAGTARGVLAEEAEGSGAVADSLRHKYPQYARVPLFSAAARFLVIRIERVQSWCAGPEALESDVDPVSPGDTRS